MTPFLAMAFIAGLVVVWVAFIATHRPPPAERVTPGDWFQTLPARDFFPPMPRLPRRRPSKGRHVR